ncbi:MAG: stage II sporulation protein P, partial [Oscillospiraceae bacterium]|nr:stage II sporulation protein P [Oscillospiraceae bacterium]
LTADGPQVLIVHTHATEAYTMPEGEEYEESDAFRTTDVRYNMVRVGDEIADTLAQCGISVLHDRTLYDYPAYNGAYTRSAESIKRYLAEYPTICFVLDVHRDAIEDTEGNIYKAVCGEDANLAQLEFVMGSDGGGASHENWRENLKLAAAVQQTAVSQYPTLMRPIILRAARYNQQLSTGSLLVEVGAAGNSLEEALLSARVFAECFADTVQGT